MASPRLAPLSLALSAVVFGGFGAAFLIRPDLMAGIGLAIERPAGAIEIRAFYGGLELGLALFFALAVARRAWHVPALVVQIVTLGGAAAGRIVGAAIAGGAEPLIVVLAALEMAGAALGAVALRQSAPPRQ